MSKQNKTAKQIKTAEQTLKPLFEKRNRATKGSKEEKTAAQAILKGIFKLSK